MNCAFCETARNATSVSTPVKSFLRFVKNIEVLVNVLSIHSSDCQVDNLCSACIKAAYRDRAAYLATLPLLEQQELVASWKAMISADQREGYTKRKRADEAKRVEDSIAAAVAQRCAEEKAKLADERAELADERAELAEEKARLEKKPRYILILPFYLFSHA